MAEPYVSPRSPMDWSAGILAGLVGGFVFLTLEMLMVPIFFGGSPWGPPRMIAAIALGENVLPAAGGAVGVGVVLTALVVHFALSIGYALILAAILGRTPASIAPVAGLAFGLALYLVNFYGFTAVFPWFATARTWVTVVTHLAFGLVAAWTYTAIAVRAPVRPA